MSASTFTQLRASAALTVRAPSLRAALMLVIPALAAAIGLYFYLVSGRYVSTDNAYVGAQKVLITPEVSGKVVRITVTEGQLLSPGASSWPSMTAMRTTLPDTSGVIRTFWAPT